MVKPVTFILLFVILAVAVAPPPPRRPVNIQAGKQENNIKWWTETSADIYTSKSFDANVGKDKYVVIQFCATFSKECEALAPAYNKLAEMYSGASAKRTDLIVSKIDGWTFNSLSQTYSVKRFPTIRFFNKGDPTNSDEYAGDLTTEKLSEWVENLIKAKSGQPAAPATEEKKPEVPIPPPKEQAAQPEATNTQASNTQATNTNQQEAAKPAETPKAAETPKPAEAGDLQKEFKLVLNTTLLQAQFDEVQKQLNTLKEGLEKNIAENFKKVETLSQSFESHKSEFHVLVDSIRGHGDELSRMTSSLNSHKDDIKSSVTSHAENHLNTLKQSVDSIKSKVWEKREEGPSGPGFMHNLIYMVIGGAISGVAVYFLAGSGAKKRRSMLD